MKTTDPFKTTIKAYLDNRAANDELFAATYAKEGKNIDDCITYILNQVKASGATGFADNEIYGMAVHYYDEDKIEVGKPIQARVVVNHSVELTDEDRAAARQKALDELVAEQKKKIAAKPKATAQPEVQQASLF